MAPAGTVTLVGAETVAAVVVVPTATTAPPEGAAPERVTVHCDDAGAVKDDGVHESVLTDTGALVIVTVAPEPVTPIGVPAPELPAGLSTWIALEVEPVLLESVKLAVAIVPSAIAVVLMPLTRQMDRPALGELHESVFPAPVADEPAFMDTLLKSVVEYAKVHCTPVD